MRSGRDYDKGSANDSLQAGKFDHKERETMKLESYTKNPAPLKVVGKEKADLQKFALPNPGNIYLLNDIVAPIVDTLKGEPLAYSLSSIQEFTSHNKYLVSEVTSCYWNTSSNEFYFGNINGRIYVFNLTTKKELEIIGSGSKIESNLIELLYVTKTNFLWFIQGGTLNSVEYKGNDKSIIPQTENEEGQMSSNLEEIRICTSQEDNSIYIEKDLNKYSRYTIEEDNRLVEQDIIEIRRDSKCCDTPDPAALIEAFYKGESLKLSLFETFVSSKGSVIK